MLSVSLNILAQRLLPDSLYQSLAASDIAKRLARGSAWSILGSATSRLLVLLGMILLARILGQTAFGEFGMIQATLGVAGMMAGFGLGSTATRFVAQHGKTDPERAGRIITLVTRSSWALVLITAFVIVGSSGPVARNILNAPHLQSALVWGTLLMAAMAIRGVQTGVLAGVERFDVIAKLNVLEGLTSLLFLVFLASMFGIEGALLGLASGSLLALAMGRYAIHRTLNGLGIITSQRGYWREKKILANYSLPSFLANMVATPVVWYCMTLVAKRPAGYDDLALYHAAYQWHGPLIFIPMILLAVSTPVLVQEWESGAFERFRKVFLLNAGLVFAISLLPVLVIAFLSSWIMSLYGEGFRNGWLILVLLAASAPLHALAKMGATALFGMNRAWSVFGLNIIWGLALFSLAMMLTPKLGAIGLATAFLTAYGVLMVSTIAFVYLSLRKASKAASVYPNRTTPTVLAPPASNA